MQAYVRGLLVVCVGLSAGCITGEEEVAGAGWAAAEPGPWDLPADTQRIGEMQFVAYDPAPPWDGGTHCSGGILAGTREIGNYLLGRFPQIRFNGGYNCRQNTADLSRTSVH